MLRKILSVGGWTLVSRVTGFVRDVVLAAIVGAGPVMDAFVVAQRLPNHLRTIFGEGAFNAAFVPAYAGLTERGGEARGFADRIFTLMLLVQLLLLAVALPAMPGIVALLAPGFPSDPPKFALTVGLSRIAFVYLLFITLVTVLSGVLNAQGRFAAAAAAPVLLNVAVVAALALTPLFPTAGHAAAWGVAAAGVLEFLLLWGAARRAGVGPRLVRPRLDADMRVFFRRLGPAVLGSAGVQLALFADTVIASFLATGAVSALYYADRLYQLPVGVIGIAAGTVLLPEMSRRIAAGDPAGAHQAQNRAVGLTLALTAPFLVLFLTLPDLVIGGLFARGAFDQEAARRAGEVLAAYALGLPAVVLIRSATASFFSRGDTATPVLASLSGIAVNIALKLALSGLLLPLGVGADLGVVGLALGTAAGAWVNLGLLTLLALRRGWTSPGATLGRTLLAVAAAAALLALFARLAPRPLQNLAASLPAWRDEALLGALGAGGALLYAAALLTGLKLLRVRLGRR